MFRIFLKMEENFRKVEIFLQADDFPHVQITFYASKSKSIMSRIEQKINSYNLFYFRIRTQVQKDEIASGELMYTVWKNTQLATQIRGECSKLTLLSPSRPPEKKNWPHTTRGFEPVISVQEAIFSVSLNSYFKAPLFFSWKFQMWHMWQCNTKGMLFRRINPWKMSQCVSLCSSRGHLPPGSQVKQPFMEDILMAMKEF